MVLSNISHPRPRLYPSLPKKYFVFITISKKIEKTRNTNTDRHSLYLFAVAVTHFAFKLSSSPNKLMASNQEPWLLENGTLKGLSREMRHGRTAHNMSSSSLRKKSDITLISKVPCNLLRQFLANLQEVILGTKLSVLFPAIFLAIAAHYYGFGRVSINYFKILFSLCS